MTSRRPPKPPTIQRTFRLLPALRPHTPDLAVGLEAVSDPSLLRTFTRQLRRFIDHGADAPKAKLRLTPEIDRRLQDLTQELRQVVRPEIAVYELVNAALLAARCNRLAPTYTRRQALPEEPGPTSPPGGR